jgi:hypothetical protein
LGVVISILAYVTVEFFAFHASTLAFILDRKEGLRKLTELERTINIPAT